MSILEWQFDGAPWAIFDVETTGLTPGFDRIIEISVVHLEPHSDEPRLVFDTLINPRRAIDEEVHGIDERDVLRAPLFSEIAQELAGALSGRVIAAHNAHFDMTFLGYEFGQIGLQLAVPYVCTMDLVEVLGLGRRASLKELGEILDVPFQAHIASEDAIATAHLLMLLRRTVHDRGICNFIELMQKASPQARYTGSWSYLPLASVNPLQTPQTRSQVSRSHRRVQPAAYRVDYGTALIEALADFVLTDEEEEYLKRIQRESELKIEQIRAAHSAALMWMMTRSAAGGWVDKREADRLREIVAYLRRLGWAPGD